MTAPDQPGPPRLAVWLLGRLLPQGVRESLLGDLTEEYRRDLDTGTSRVEADRRFWRESGAALVALVRRRPATPLLEESDLMGTLLTDLRYAVRHLGRRPGFTALAVLIMALGIGATTAIFSVVNPVLFRSLPYQDPDRLVMLWERGADGLESNIGFATFADIRARSHTLAQVAAMGSWQPTLSGGSEPERLAGQRVSASYFSLLGVAPALGRGFLEEEDSRSAPRVVVLSDGLWRRRFDADPALVGRTITMDGTAYTVAGIMPRGFENLLDPTAQIWTPLRYDASLPYACRTCRHLRMVGRIGPGVSVSDTKRELELLSSALFEEYPTEYPVAGMFVVPLQHQVTRAARPVLLAVLGAVALVLLIACANVTHLLLGQAARRQREFALRAALGAGRGRLVRQLLTESMLLALVGGAAGLLLAGVGLRLLLALAPATLPRLEGVGLDRAVLLFALGLTTLTGLLFGLAPALAASRSALQATLQRAGGGGGNSRHGGRGALVVSEVSLAVVLLLGAGLLLRSLGRLVTIDPGFRSQGLLTMEVQTTGPAFREDEPTWAFFDQALAAVRAAPGVEDAAFTSLLPMGGNYDSYGVAIEEKPNPNPELNPSALRFAVSPRYLETMQIPVLRGRGLTEADAVPGAPSVVLINQTFARHVWPDEDPVGKRLRISERIGWRTIVGIVGDVRHGGLDEVPADQIYLPERHWNWADPAMTLVVRTRGDAAALTPAVRRAIWSVDKDQPIGHIATMEELVSASTAERRFALRLFGTFAVVAMVLAAAGIYGALSGSVTERTRELGIRMALGATAENVLGMVMREGGLLIGFGLAIGLGGAALLGRLLQTLLYGVSPHDAVAQVTVALVFLVVGLLASMVPARRASRLDPIRTLKCD
jgi:putative ABC transport system permease protein